MTTGDAKGRTSAATAAVGPDTPFGDLFEEFFNRRGLGRDGQNQQGERQAPQPRRSQSAGSAS